MSQTSLQVCFDNRTQTVPLVPSNIHHLLDFIQETFNNLPSTWRLQYQNDNKELLEINTQQDYKELVLNLKTGSALVVNIVPDIQKQDEYVESGRQLESEGGNPDFFSEESFSLIEDDKNEPNDIKSVSSSSKILNPENMNQDDQDSVNEYNVLEAVERKSFETLEYAPAPVENPSPCVKELSIDFDEKEIVNQVPPQTNINDMIDRSIAMRLPEIAMLVKEYFENDQSLKPAVDINKSIHSHYYCDECGADPIVGPRYKCSVCPDFDICENCEKTIQHPHLFLKINHPNDIEKLHNNSHMNISIPQIFKHQPPESPDIMREFREEQQQQLKGRAKHHLESEEDEDDPEGEEEYEDGDSQYEYEYEDEEEEEKEGFNLKGLGKKLKETTLVKVLSGTYGQLPGQAMNAISNFFGSFKESPTSSDDENFSDEDSDDEEYY